jgi:hypothetical protein
MTPAQIDELGDEDFAAMVRLMQAEAEAWDRLNSRARR